MKNLEKIDMLLAAVRRNESADIAYERIAKRQAALDRKTKEGEYAEKEVCTWIGRLPYVREVIRYKRGSGHDFAGHDARVRFTRQVFLSHFGEYPNFNNIFLQIKSTKLGESRFISEKSDDEGEVMEWMASQRVILLSCQQGEGACVDSFVIQLKKIVEYYKK